MWGQWLTMNHKQYMPLTSSNELGILISSLTSSVHRPKSFSHKRCSVQRKTKPLPSFLIPWKLFQEKKKGETPYSMNLTKPILQAPETGNTFLTSFDCTKEHYHFVYVITAKYNMSLMAPSSPSDVYLYLILAPCCELYYH